MSFEHPTYSFNHSSGEPPTPTRTPSSPNFFTNSYQTPKQDSKAHDPLSPWPPAFGASPSFPLMTHTPPPHGDTLPSFSEKTKTAEEVASEVAARPQHSTSDHSLSLAPVDTSRQLPSSPQPSLQFDVNPSATAPSKLEATSSKEVGDPRACESMNSASSIQTPPPTSTSTSRRKASEAHAARSARALADKTNMGGSNPAAAGAGELAVVTQHQVEESPSTHFPSLQFSPDGFGFPLSTAPATAPVYPQNKLFWDPEQSMDNMNLDFPMDDTFTNFGLGLQKQLEPFVSEHDPPAESHDAVPHIFSVTGTNAVSITNPTAPKHSMALNQTNIGSSTAIMTQGSSRGNFNSTVVNPSLLFSSPGARTHPSSQAVQDDALKPYAHQLQDAEYEKELQSRRPKRKRGIELDSPAVKAATQALRGAEDASSVDSTDGVVIASFGGPVRPMSRRSRNRSGHTKSASKGQEVLGHPGEYGKRPSVTLTIDENGRAKTETKLVEDSRQSLSSEMQVDSDSSDSESSSSESSQGLALSQPSSFAYPVERQKKSKTPKSHKGHGVQSSHSHHSSYASTLGSHGSAGNVSLKKQNHTDHRRASQPQVHFKDTTSFVGGPLGEEDSEAETIVDEDEDKGNAASELKRVVRQRSNQKLRKDSIPRQSFADHRMPSGAQPHPYYNQHTRTPSRLGSSQVQQNISPTTITDPEVGALSSAGGHSIMSAGSITRCVCNIPDGDGQLMVQCDSCKNWLHLDCVGLNQHNIPEIYLCIFCNHETPKVRGARREPARAVFPPPSSPLAYKSQKFG